MSCCKTCNCKKEVESIGAEVVTSSKTTNLPIKVTFKDSGTRGYTRDARFSKTYFGHSENKHTVLEMDVPPKANQVQIIVQSAKNIRVRFE